MAVTYDIVVVAHDETTENVQRDLIAETGHVMLAGLKLKDYFKTYTSGIRPATIQTKANAAKASGTITLASLANNDVITISGVGFTAKTSGAAGANEFNLGVSDTTAAANAATAINANTSTDGLIIATSSTTVLTLTALVPGELGNAVTIAISLHGTASGARLTGGTNGDVERTHYYGSAS